MEFFCVYYKYSLVLARLSLYQLMRKYLRQHECWQWPSETHYILVLSFNFHLTNKYTTKNEKAYLQKCWLIGEDTIHVMDVFVCMLSSSICSARSSLSRCASVHWWMVSSLVCTLYWLLQLHTITVLLSALTVFNYTREQEEEWRRTTRETAKVRERDTPQIDRWSETLHQTN